MTARKVTPDDAEAFRVAEAHRVLNDSLSCAQGHTLTVLAEFSRQEPPGAAALTALARLAANLIAGREAAFCLSAGIGHVGDSKP
jgi:hypothetical protein